MYSDGAVLKRDVFFVVGTPVPIYRKTFWDLLSDAFSMLTSFSLTSCIHYTPYRISKRDIFSSVDSRGHTYRAFDDLQTAIEHATMVAQKHRHEIYDSSTNSKSTQGTAIPYIFTIGYPKIRCKHSTSGYGSMHHYRWEYEGDPSLLRIRRHDGTVSSDEHRYIGNRSHYAEMVDNATISRSLCNDNTLSFTRKLNYSDPTKSPVSHFSYDAAVALRESRGRAAAAGRSR